MVGFFDIRNTQSILRFWFRSPRKVLPEELRNSMQIYLPDMLHGPDLDLMDHADSKYDFHINGKMINT